MKKIYKTTVDDASINLLKSVIGFSIDSVRYKGNYYRYTDVKKDIKYEIVPDELTYAVIIAFSNHLLQKKLLFEYEAIETDTYQDYFSLKIIDITAEDRPTKIMKTFNDFVVKKIHLFEVHRILEEEDIIMEGIILFIAEPEKRILIDPNPAGVVFIKIITDSFKINDKINSTNIYKEIYNIQLVREIQ